MRASKLLRADVVDETGRSLGPVRDLRITPDSLEIVGLVVGGGPVADIAHGWGYAEGRAAGPWLLRAATGRAARRARMIPSGRVVAWGSETIQITGSWDDLPRLCECANDDRG
jgi:sporulation protein YlmC with PRC-barrel domain